MLPCLRTICTIDSVIDLFYSYFIKKILGLLVEEYKLKNATYLILFALLNNIFRRRFAYLFSHKTYVYIKDKWLDIFVTSNYISVYWQLFITKYFEKWDEAYNVMQKNLQTFMNSRMTLRKRTYKENLLKLVIKKNVAKHIGQT